MKAFMPRIEITLSQIYHNARMLSELYGRKGISLMGVSKATLGNPVIAEVMIQGGVKFIADSRIENIQKMRDAGVSTQFVLLRTALSQAEAVIRDVDISLNTELDTVRELSHYAKVYDTLHHIIVMVELGDLREGVVPCDLLQFVKEASNLPYIEIIGIGCNLACYGGIKPDKQKMDQLSKLVDAIEIELHIDLKIISGGNSANYEWYQSVQEVGRTNNLRLGESILLGCDPLNRKAIPGLHTNAFKLIAEVIESKEKPSLPFGEMGRDAFGNVPTFFDRGIHHRVIIALGRQDVLVSGLKVGRDLEILGASSDHVVLDSNHCDCKVGSEVKFNLDYGGLLSAMNSPFIKKQFVSNKEYIRSDEMGSSSKIVKTRI